MRGKRREASELEIDERLNVGRGKLYDELHYKHEKQQFPYPQRLHEQTDEVGVELARNEVHHHHQTHEQAPRVTSQHKVGQLGYVEVGEDA